jgi:tryptophan synthase alpha chain
MNRIDTVLAQLKSEGRKALIPFITAGDPSLPKTLELMHALVKGGVDIIELGIPFSDPMADGPTIQRASDRAVKRGVGLRNVLDIVAEFRVTNQQTPVVLMGYANPLEAMGINVFAPLAQQLGVDGVLIVDYPPEEAIKASQVFSQHGLHPIFLIAPTTTDERIIHLAAQAKGYVYYVSLNGVTGAGHLDVEAVNRRIDHLRKHITLPIGVGFGIRDAQTAVTLAHTADAVVIGSRLVELIESTPIELINHELSEWLMQVRQALDKEFHA